MVLLGFLAMGLIANGLYISFDIRGFELEKYPWYLELRALHYIHHLGATKSNLGMLNMGIDGLFVSLTWRIL